MMAANSCETPSPVHRPPDLFAPEPEPDLFGAEAARPACRPDPDRVRRRLERILAEARGFGTMPWEPTQLSLYRTIVPQMTLWLPDDEAAQWRLDFETEMARFEEAA